MKSAVCHLGRITAQLPGPWQHLVAERLRGERLVKSSGHQRSATWAERRQTVFLQHLIVEA